MFTGTYRYPAAFISELYGIIQQVEPYLIYQFFFTYEIYFVEIKLYIYILFKLLFDRVSCSFSSCFKTIF